MKPLLQIDYSHRPAGSALIKLKRRETPLVSVRCWNCSTHDVVTPNPIRGQIGASAAQMSMSPAWPETTAH